MMYKVKGTTLDNLGEIRGDFETLEDAENFIRKMAIEYGVEAQVIEVQECCKYSYPYNRQRKEVMQILDQHGVKYTVDKFLNIKIEF